MSLAPFSGKKQCDCTFPACKDTPDSPLAGKWCSLCGPKYNDYITIGLCNLPNSAYNDDDQTVAVGNEE